jgi:hypothetical protein
LHLYSKQSRLKTLKFGRSTPISETAWKNYLELASTAPLFQATETGGDVDEK